MATFGSAQDGVATNVTTETKTVQSGRTRVYGVHVSGPAAAGANPETPSPASARCAVPTRRSPGATRRRPGGSCAPAAPGVRR